LVSYATYYRSQVCATEQPELKKETIKTLHQSKAISAKQFSNTCDSIASIAEESEAKPST